MVDELAGRRIFAIDDDEVIRLSVRHVLARAGYEVHEFASGQEALAALETVRPHLVFVDLRMPGMDGFEVIARLLAVDPGLPIVVMTGYASIATAVEAMKAGAYDFLAKPFSPDELRLVARRALERGRLIRETRALKKEKDEVSELNRRLTSLYALVQAVSTAKALDAVLATVAAEVAAVMQVPITTVQLGRDGEVGASYAAVHGLPATVLERPGRASEPSLLLRRALAGESFVTGPLADHDARPDEAMTAAGIQSVAFAPLMTQQRVIGVLGAFSPAGSFNDADSLFFRRAADIAAIAIEDARQREAITELLRERTRFMLQVAHNLRAPLAASVSLLEALEGGYLGELVAQQLESIGRVRDRLHHLGQMVNELLTLTQVRSREAPLELVPCDLRAVVAKAAAMFQEQATDGGLSLRLTLPPAPLQVLGDAGTLGQVVENLISNALKYSLPGGIIAVACERRDASWATIEVRDQGIGIPAADQERLFDEFFRARNARKLRKVGTGLGLSIVKQTAAQHGGRVHFQSSEGQGTTFTVELPLLT